MSEFAHPHGGTARAPARPPGSAFDVTRAFDYLYPEDDATSIPRYHGSFAPQTPPELRKRMEFLARAVTAAFHRSLSARDVASLYGVSLHDAEEYLERFRGIGPDGIVPSSLREPTAEEAEFVRSRLNGSNGHRAEDLFHKASEAAEIRAWLTRKERERQPR